MKKKLLLLYMAVCLLVCLVPFAGMLKWPTVTTTENREMAKMPKATVRGKVNIHYLEQLGDYFEDHYAFRNWLVSADSKIMGEVFMVSPVEKVVYGKNHWLYYASTLDDYLGQNLASDRQIYNLARNLSLVESYVEDQGSRFLFTIAPNKNSLYGDNMPFYYQHRTRKAGNAERLAPLLTERKIPYADLFALFKSQDEVLYLKRDSHWNNKGALLAWQEIMGCLETECDSYETVRGLRTRDYIGDLNKMLYPKLAEPEFNISYKKEMSWHYSKGSDVTDNWIDTVNDEGDDSLLMYRDSFGNTLLPLMADTYKEGHFVNERAYALERQMKEYDPDVVVIEKVERNIMDYISWPPVMTAPQAENVSSASDEAEEKTNATKGSEGAEEKTNAWEESTANREQAVNPEESKGADIWMNTEEEETDFYCISGQIRPDLVKTDSDILVELSSIDSEDPAVTYEAYGIEDNGYEIFLRKDLITRDRINVRIMIRDGNEIRPIASKEIDVNAIRIREDEE